jgi:hypothetical protein
MATETRGPRYLGRYPKKMAPAVLSIIQIVSFLATQNLPGLPNVGGDNGTSGDTSSLGFSTAHRAFGQR